MKRAVKGSTLVELLVALLIVALIATVTGLTFRAPDDPTAVDPVEARIADARRDAVRSGRTVTVVTWWEGHAITATAHPDGQVVADTGFAVDRFSGRRAP